MLKIIKLNPYTLNLFNCTLNELNLSVLVEVMCVNISIITHFIKLKHVSVIMSFLSKILFLQSPAFSFSFFTLFKIQSRIATFNLSFIQTFSDTFTFYIQ